MSKTEKHRVKDFKVNKREIILKVKEIFLSLD